MNGYEYEEFCRKNLKKCGFTKVKVTQKSGDYGVDITAYYGSTKYAIQCKNYSSPVGLAAVQQVHAGLKMYECDKAAVLTNSTFTQQAKNLAKSNGVCLWEKDKITPPSMKYHVTKLLRFMYWFFLIVGVLSLLSQPSGIGAKILNCLSSIILILASAVVLMDIHDAIANFIAAILYFIFFVMFILFSFVEHGLNSNCLILLLPVLTCSCKFLTGSRTVDDKPQYSPPKPSVSDELDSYFWLVADYVVNEQTCSFGRIQRIFKIDYQRTDRILNQLEKRGIIALSKNRAKIFSLLSLDEYEAMKPPEADPLRDIEEFLDS